MSVAGHAIPEPGSQAAETLAVTVLVCAYTERRWTQTRAAIESVLAQSPKPAQVILVVDHNAPLAALARRQLAGITVLDSDGQPGLSGARNTGLRAASQPVTVFLDDDAVASPGWLASLVAPYRRPEVVSTGGSVQPRWPGTRPRWLPATFDWVVGCSYLGLPESGGPVRNPIGANMSVRTDRAIGAGAFDTGIGRVGRHPRGCEETELAIRMKASQPDAVILYVPEAAVEHHVAQERLSVRYFIRRCWHEGRSKADVVRLAGRGPGLASERRQAAAVIPAALLRDLRAAAGADAAALARIIATVSGLAAAAGGYLSGRAVQAKDGTSCRQ